MVLPSQHSSSAPSFTCEYIGLLWNFCCSLSSPWSSSWVHEHTHFQAHRAGWDWAWGLGPAPFATVLPLGWVTQPALLCLWDKNGLNIIFFFFYWPSSRFCEHLRNETGSEWYLSRWLFLSLAFQIDIGKTVCMHAFLVFIMFIPTAKTIMKAQRNLACKLCYLIF